MEPSANDDRNDRPPHPFDRLNERHRIYLRHVAWNRTSKEIAHVEGVSARAVDKQLFQAKNLIGAPTRAEAARRLVAFEKGVESLYPANALPVQQPLLPLPLPVPNRRMPVNLIKARAVLIWTAIIGLYLHCRFHLVRADSDARLGLLAAGRTPQGRALDDGRVADRYRSIDP